MGNIYKNSIDNNGELLNSIVLSNLDKSVVRYFSYATILPFDHPVFVISQGESLDNSGASTSCQIRSNTEFTVTLSAVSDEQKDSIINGLTDLGLLPSIKRQFQPYIITHPQLLMCDLEKILIKKIRQPTFTTKTMIWELECIEWRKPIPIKRILDPKGGATPKKSSTPNPIATTAADVRNPFAIEPISTKKPVLFSEG